MAMTRAQRAAQVKAIVHEQPGIRASEVAERMGVSPGTVSLTVKVLTKADVIERGRGLGLRPSVTELRRKLISSKWR